MEDANALVLDILEKVGATETIAMLRKKLGDTHEARIPPGFPVREDPDSAFLADIIEALVKRKYNTGCSGLFSSSQLNSSEVVEVEMDVPSFKDTQVKAEPLVAKENEKAEDGGEGSLENSSLLADGVASIPSHLQNSSVMNTLSSMYSAIHESITEGPATPLIPSHLRNSSALSTLSSMYTAIHESAVGTGEGTSTAKVRAKVEGYLDYEEDSEEDSEEENAPTLDNPAEEIPASVPPTILAQKVPGRRGVSGAGRCGPTTAILEGGEEEDEEQAAFSKSKSANALVIKTGWGDDCDDKKTVSSIPITDDAPVSHSKGPNAPPRGGISKKATCGTTSAPLIEEDISHENNLNSCSSKEGIVPAHETAPHFTAPISASIKARSILQPQTPPTTPSASCLGMHLEVARMVSSATPYTANMTSVPLSPAHASMLRWFLVGFKRGIGGVGRPLYSGWLPQGLHFSRLPGTGYGILQKAGGPCGPLASINAEACKRLYFGATPASTESSLATIRKSWEDFLNAASSPWSPQPPIPTGTEDIIELEPSPLATALALVGALVDILWRCRPHDGAPVLLVFPDMSSFSFSSIEEVEKGVEGLTSPVLNALRTPGGCPRYSFTLPGDLAVDAAALSQASPTSLPQENLFERLSLFSCTSRADAATAITAHLPLLTHPAGPGILLVVASALSTRGWKGLLQDRDAQQSDSSSMIDSSGYCTSELLHLFLCGRGVSNSFNMGASVEGVTLGGIPHPCEVGFLSGSPHCPVGTYLQRPAAPVWVTFSASHYRMMLALPAGCIFPDLPPTPPRRLFGRKPGPPSLPPSEARCVGCALSSWGEGGEGLGGEFDALLWDGLSKQEEMHRITVRVPSSHTVIPPSPPGQLEALYPPTLIQLISRFGEGTTVLWGDVEEEEPLIL